MPGLNLTRDEARARATLISVESYDVELDLTSEGETFPSRSSVRFQCREPGSETFIDLVAPSVQRVVLNGRELAPEAVFEEGRIRLLDLAADNELVVEAACAYMNTGEGLHRFVDPVDGQTYLYTDLEPADARRVFAVFEQPDLKAPFTFSVLARPGWQVISNQPAGSPQSAMEGRAGNILWRFPATPPLPSYVTAVAAGPWQGSRASVASQDGREVPLGLFCRASLVEYLDAEALFAITRAGFAYFERLFGRPYPFAKYDQLFVPQFNAGGMENAGAVTLTEHDLFRSREPDARYQDRADVLLHELSHMWFGDLVTMRWWDDLWLNETFATYAAIGAVAATTGWQPWTSFTSGSKPYALAQDQLPTSHPVVADIVDLEALSTNFDAITYEKGAAAIQQLVAWVGADHFFEGLRQYIEHYAWGNAELADLLRALEAASGRDLRAWSRRWLEEAGVTTLHSDLEVQDGRIARLEIVQEAPADRPALPSHRAAVGSYALVDGLMRRTDRIELDIVGARTLVPGVSGRPRPDVILLNDGDLTYAKIRLDATSQAFAFDHIGAFEDPLTRALIWSIAWDLTRDAELPAHAFAELVTKWVTGEDQSQTVQVQLGRLAAALDRYSAPETRSALATAAAGRLLELAREAEPGSDLQLQLLRAFSAHASSAEQLDVVEALLAGQDHLPDCAIDVDRRWELLMALAVGGRVDEARIDAELARDDTERGRRYAATARAAMPSPAAKQAAWDAVVERDDLPNAVQGAVIAGFRLTHDPTLVTPFVERYFEVLDRIWQTRTPATARRIATGLYPTWSIEPRVIELSDRALDATDPSRSALRRILIEGRDTFQRALRAQERDRHS
jgi:aminopeptidase N